ncbi:MAG: diguanylate cyclase domain-containing protein [Acidimicrobiales bacterium]
MLRHAFSDALTGLLGREAFLHRLGEALDGWDHRQTTAVVLVDLDGFRALNHVFGGTTGDQILVAVAGRLAATLRPDDSLARFGGDQYAVLLIETTEEAAQSVAERVVQTIGLPITVPDGVFTVSGSAGIATAATGEDAAVLVDRAQVALSKAKEAGSGRIVLYAPELAEPAPRRREVRTDMLQDRLSHLLLMQASAVAANGAETLSEAAETLMPQFCAHIGCVAGSLWCPSAIRSDEGAPRPVWHVSTGIDASLRAGTETSLTRWGAVLAERVMDTGRPLWVTDSADAEWLGAGWQGEGPGIGSAFAFPVLAGQDVVGVLAFFTGTRIQPSASFLDVLVGIGTQLGRVVERQRSVETLRQSEDDLRASQARLREAQAVARLGSWEFDVRTGDLRWSEGMHALFGVDPDDHLRFGCLLDHAHPADRLRGEAAWARLVETGEPIAEDIRIVLPDGQVRWHRCEGTGIRDESGAVVAVQGTSQDITERKLTEEVLRRRERRLFDAQRTIRLGWWQRDLLTGRHIWSDHLCRLWGREPGDPPTSEEFLASVHPDDRRRLLDVTDQLRLTGEPVCLVFRAVVANGRQRSFRGVAQLLHDEHGTPIKRFGTVEEVADEEEAERDALALRELCRGMIKGADHARRSAVAFSLGAESTSSTSLEP